MLSLKLEGGGGLMLRVGDYSSNVKRCLGARMKYNGEKRADFRRPATSAGSSLRIKKREALKKLEMNFKIKSEIENTTREEN
jgi:hypothetical protein